MRLETIIDQTQRLDPRVWANNFRLVSSTQTKLNHIVDSFFEHLGLPQLYITDIVIKGKCALPTWTEDCNLNLSIVYDSKQSVAKYGSAFDKYVQDKLNLWNENNQYYVAKHKVIIRAETNDTPQEGLPTYSLKEQEWIIEPEIIKEYNNKEN